MWFRRRSRVVNPVGWDERHQRVHDVGFQVDGALMHYSTCWCRRCSSCGGAMTDPPCSRNPETGHGGHTVAGGCGTGGAK